MKNKLRRDIFVIIFLLLVACIALAVPLAFSNPRWLLAPALLVVFALVVAVLGIRRLRRFVADMLCGTNFEGSKTQYSLADFSIPTALITEGSVVWYNPAFREQILAGQDALLAAPDRLMTGIDLSVCARAHGQDLTIDENRYTAYATTSRSSKTGTLLFLVNDTFYKNTLDEYTASRPAYLIIGVDSYDELFNDMKDSEQAHELEAINTLLEEYIGRTTGFLRKVSNSRYIAVVEERDIRWMMEERFDILDKVRALHPGGMLTLSIGVGHGGATMQECQEMARESIDIALGRGGDQAAVKTVDGFEFFGGISHGVEKRSHVRSRIIANALADQIRQSDSVIIMGHRQSDLDAIGSAIGLLRMCKMCDVPSVIAVRSKATLAGQLLDVFNKAGEDHNFIEPEETYKLITPKTLLIVTDTYQKRLLEDQKIYEKCSRVVVIDHHRMAVGHIDNPILLYHEPFASSASELVCELLQFMPAQNNITQLEAQALLSGIMLDTRSFALHVGVRTFEAAAFLRRNGADVTRVRKLFRENAAEYKAKADAVGQAEIYRNDYAISVCRSDGIQSPTIVGAQAANELLNIRGIKASFVLTEYQGRIYISARSIDEVNVQVIMERMGGGGHMNVAGCQIDNSELGAVIGTIKGTLDKMIEEGELR